MRRYSADMSDVQGIGSGEQGEASVATLQLPEVIFNRASQDEGHRKFVGGMSEDRSLPSSEQICATD